MRLAFSNDIIPVPVTPVGRINKSPSGTTFSKDKD